MASSSSSLDTNTINIYIHDQSFVLVKQDSVIELFFNGTLKKKDNYRPNPDIKPYKCYGIIGLLNGFINKHLVVISQAQQRGQLFGHSIFTIEKATCLALNAQTAIQTNDDDKVEEIVTSLSSNSEPSLISALPTSTVIDQALSNPSVIESSSPPTQPVKITSPSLLNMFKKSFNNNNNNSSIDRPASAPASLKQSSSATTMNTSLSNKNIASDTSLISMKEDKTALEQRLIKEVTGIFSRNMFIFAYDFDVTNCLQRHFKKRKQANESTSTMAPSRKYIDKRFWWNEHLSQDFILAKLENWVCPVMQGTVQIEPCDIDGFPFTFVLISRRSCERAGLRYQRRGVNDDGQVANFVETEQLVVFEREGVHHVASFVQTRGSIPLFWSQSAYALHPDPVLHRSDEENAEAFGKHFQQQESLYGPQIIVNLTELAGREAIIGSEYRHHIEKLADPSIKYVEFDFHKETKGMRFENIKKLGDSLSDDVTKMAYFWEGDDDTVFCEQTSVFRTNCMDCLDRTNVVQSSFARQVLNLQLMRFGITDYPDKGIKYYEQFERIFNNVWANNGDMISRMYTGTSALKGDFTRTGKRNITGIMNDASNSLARMYFNTVKDFHRQAAIDYVLGYHKIDIFKRVPESNERSAEPGMEKWLEKIRNEAIQVSCEIVIADDETKLHGWTLLAPKDNKNGKPSSKRFEEKVVLLTRKALYVCSYNYHLEKVVQFKRVELRTIKSIQMGDYILSSLTPESRDPDENYGFNIVYNSNNQIMRWNTGSILNQNLDDLNILASDVELGKEDGTESDSSLSSQSSSSSSSSNTDIEDKDLTPAQEACLSFKAVRYNVSEEWVVEKLSTCKQQVQDIVKHITTQCGHSMDPDGKFVVYKPIISLAQAEKTDGLFKKMGYKLKHAIWI
ncbi:SacI homology domain-containing protein [Chlamydoabsidia padenii]|nr:SacI homology domain-containing protein [Chlamydoabsidia padenii]